MSITPYLAGSRLRADMLTVPQPYQAVVSGGPTSSTTELVIATLVVPAQAIATLQVPSADWVGFTTNVDSRFTLRLRDTNTSGTIRGSTLGAMTNSVDRMPLSISHGLIREVPASTTATYVVTVQRVAGTGNAETSAAGYLTVLVLPDL